jgi:hypothetical protein
VARVYAKALRQRLIAMGEAVLHGGMHVDVGEAMGCRCWVGIGLSGTFKQHVTRASVRARCTSSNGKSWLPDGVGCPRPRPRTNTPQPRGGGWGVDPLVWPAQAGTRPTEELRMYAPILWASLTDVPMRISSPGTVSANLSAHRKTGGAEVPASRWNTDHEVFILRIRAEGMVLGLIAVCVALA